MREQNGNVGDSRPAEHHGKRCHWFCRVLGAYEDGGSRQARHVWNICLRVTGPPMLSHTQASQCILAHFKQTEIDIILKRKKAVRPHKMLAALLTQTIAILYSFWVSWLQWFPWEKSLRSSQIWTLAPPLMLLCEAVQPLGGEGSGSLGGVPWSW